MPHYVPNKYRNIFGCHIFTKQISGASIIKHSPGEGEKQGPRQERQILNSAYC